MESSPSAVETFMGVAPSSLKINHHPVPNVPAAATATIANVCTPTAPSHLFCFHSPSTLITSAVNRSFFASLSIAYTLNEAVQTSSDRHRPATPPASAPASLYDHGSHALTLSNCACSVPPNCLSINSVTSSPTTIQTVAAAVACYLANVVIGLSGPSDLHTSKSQVAKTSVKPS